jgi:PadR family transcriptional regulator PadR
LAVLAKGDAYGYKLTQDVKGVIAVSESTLYPVLRRLQGDGMLSTYDKPFNGRNRRYYSITPIGCQRLGELVDAWEGYKRSVDAILANSVIGGGSAAASADKGTQTHKGGAS